MKKIFAIPLVKALQSLQQLIAIVLHPSIINIRQLSAEEYQSVAVPEVLQVVAQEELSLG